MHDTLQLSPTQPPVTAKHWRWWRVLLPTMITQIIAFIVIVGITFLGFGAFSHSQSCSEMALLVCGVIASVAALFLGVCVYFGIGLLLFYKWKIKNFGGVVTLGFFSTVVISWIVSYRTSLLPMVAFPIMIVAELSMYIFWDWFLNATKIRKIGKIITCIGLLLALIFVAIYDNGASGIYTAWQSNDLKSALQKAPMTIYAPSASFKTQLLDVYPYNSSTDQFDKGVQITLTDNLNLMEYPAPTGDPITDCGLFVSGVTSCQVATTLPSGDKIYTADDGTYFMIKDHTVVSTGGGMPYTLTAQDVYDIFDALQPTTASALVHLLPKH